MLGGLGPTLPPTSAEPQVRNIEELDLEQLLGKVTAASRTEESVLTAPATVTVIDQEQIRQSAATTVPDLLRNVAGVQVLELAPGNYLVSLRGTGGLTGNNVVVLLDGIPLNSRIDGNVDWGAIPIDLAQIDRIEIVRGPVSTIYGPDAYTGVINIVSVAPADTGVGRLARIGAGVDSAGRADGRRRRHRQRHQGQVLGPPEPQRPLRQHLRRRRRHALLGDGRRHRVRAVRGDAQHHHQPRARRLVQPPQLARPPRARLAAAGHHAGVRRRAPRHARAGADRRLARDLGARARADHRLQPELHRLHLSRRQAAATRSSAPICACASRITSSCRSAATAASSTSTRPSCTRDETGHLRPRYGFYADAGLELWNHVSLSAAVRGDASAVSNGLQFAGRGSIIYHANKYALRLTAGSAYRDPTYVEVASRFVDPATNLILIEGTPGPEPAAHHVDRARRHRGALLAS